MARSSVVLLVAIVFLGGCGATRGVVHDTIAEGTTPESLNNLRPATRALAGEAAKGLIDGASIDRAAVRELAGDVAKGLLDGVPIDSAAVDRFVRTVLHAASQGLEADVSPAMAHAVRATVDEVLAAILSDGTKRGVAEIADALTAAAMAGLARGFREQIAPAIANALDTQLGPAMQRLIEKNLGPAFATALQHDLGPAFAATLQRDLGPAFATTLQRDLGPAFAATLQRDLGPAFAATLQRDLGPAFANTARQTSTAVGAGFVDGTKPLVDRVQSMIERADQDAHSILRVVLVVILAIVTGVLAVLLWLRHQAAIAGRDALQLVTSEIGRMSAEPAIVELARRIKAAGERSKAGAFLADHLHAHPSSKVKPSLQA